MKKANYMKNNKGFSLVELAMLMALAAVLAGISIPVLTSSMHSMQLISDVRGIATTMTYAKLSAVSQLTDYKLMFTLTGKEWELYKLKRGTVSDWELQQAKKGISGGVANSDIRFKQTSTSTPSSDFGYASSGTITFNSQGTPVEGASIVYLTNNDQNWAISVSIAGKIQVWKQNGTVWDAI